MLLYSKLLPTDNKGEINDLFCQLLDCIDGRKTGGDPITIEIQFLMQALDEQLKLLTDYSHRPDASGDYDDYWASRYLERRNAAMIQIIWRLEFMISESKVSGSLPKLNYQVQPTSTSSQSDVKSHGDYFASRENFGKLTTGAISRISGDLTLFDLWHILDFVLKKIRPKGYLGRSLLGGGIPVNFDSVPDIILVVMRELTNKLMTPYGHDCSAWCADLAALCDKSLPVVTHDTKMHAEVPETVMMITYYSRYKDLEGYLRWFERRPSQNSQEADATKRLVFDIGCIFVWMTHMKRDKIGVENITTKPVDGVVVTIVHTSSHGINLSELNVLMQSLQRASMCITEKWHRGMYGVFGQVAEQIHGAVGQLLEKIVVHKLERTIAEHPDTLDAMIPSLELEHVAKWYHDKMPRTDISEPGFTGCCNCGHQTHQEATCPDICGRCNQEGHTRTQCIEKKCSCGGCGVSDHPQIPDTPIATKCVKCGDWHDAGNTDECTSTRVSSGPSVVPCHHFVMDSDGTLTSHSYHKLYQCFKKNCELPSGWHQCTDCMAMSPVRKNGTIPTTCNCGADTSCGRGFMN
jgi:hypothetical protein